jgi:hypothetical protein
MMKAVDTSLQNDPSMNHWHHHHNYTTSGQLQGSPISVIPFEITDGDSTVNRSAVSRRLFGTPTAQENEDT